MLLGLVLVGQIANVIPDFIQGPTTIELERWHSGILLWYIVVLYVMSAVTLFVMWHTRVRCPHYIKRNDKYMLYFILTAFAQFVLVFLAALVVFMFDRSIFPGYNFYVRHLFQFLLFAFPIQLFVLSILLVFPTHRWR